MKYKYTTTFEAEIFASSDVPQFEEKCKESLAALEDVAPSCGENIDLLAVAFDGAVINAFNKNDDGMASSVAVSMKDNFRHKPINIEHDRSRIIGHITNAVFTDKSSKQFMFEEDALMTKHPYNLTLGGFIYKMVNSEFYDELSDSMDDMSPNYHSISASWEVGFNTFGIAFGSEEVQHCDIITNPIEVAQYAEYLKAFGGDGYAPDGRRVYRLIMGEVYPLGMGFVKNPAADVKGIHHGDKTDAECDKHEKAAAKTDPDISQSEKSNVKSPDQIISMDLLEQLKEALAAQEKVTEEVAASITKQFADLIRQSDEKYRQQLEEKEQAVTAANEKQEALEETVAELKEQLQKQDDELKEIKEAQAQEALENSRNQRMEQIDSLYELNDEDRKVIFQDLANIDVTSDEAFEAYAGKLAILLRDKNKEVLAEAAQKAEEEKEVKEATASEKPEEKEAAEAVAEANVDGEETKVPNNNGGDNEESFVSRFGAAFNEDNVKIS
jgi:hypothetical protein